MNPDHTNRLFGTDGIRAKAGEFPLDSGTVETIGSSLARHIAERGGGHARIVTGRDTRESGAWIERALIAGAQKSGAEVESAGVITTPGVAFLARSLGANAGIVISASHNPYHDNGIKVFDPSGRKLDDATERMIETDVASSTVATREAIAVTPSSDFDHSVELRGRYFEYLSSEIGRGLSLKGLKLVVDCANGAAYEIAPRLFARFGAEVVALNNEPDGRNINLNCGSLHIDGLRQRVIQEQADVGVAFDGDADRALFVDSAGAFVDGDATMWALANYLKARNELTGNAVVATVMSNIGLEIALKSEGIKMTRTDVGDKYVLEELLRSGAALGGEQSGHIIFPQVSLAGDGMITTLRLLRVMQDQQQGLADLTRGFQRYPQLLLNILVSEKRPFHDLPSVQNLAAEIEKKLDERGRLLLRYSGTEPLARVMIEGESEAEIRDYAERLAALIRDEIGRGDS